MLAREKQKQKDHCKGAESGKRRNELPAKYEEREGRERISSRKKPDDSWVASSAPTRQWKGKRGEESYLGQEVLMPASNSGKMEAPGRSCDEMRELLRNA